jgi:RHS repeat-associated protein
MRLDQTETGERGTQLAGGAVADWSTQFVTHARTGPDSGGWTVHFDSVTGHVEVEYTLSGSTLAYQLTADGQPVSVTNGPAGPVTQLADDGHGNVTTAVNASAGVSCTTRYDPWGSPLAAGSTTNPCNTGSTVSDAWFQGARLDSSNSGYQFGSRTYVPVMGSFLTPDSYRAATTWGDLALGIDPTTANRYSYATGDPINLVDPTGHGIQGCGPDCNNKSNQPSSPPPEQNQQSLPLWRATNQTHPADPSVLDTSNLDQCASSIAGQAYCMPSANLQVAPRVQMCIALGEMCIAMGGPSPNDLIDEINNWQRSINDPLARIQRLTTGDPETDGAGLIGGGTQSETLGIDSAATAEGRLITAPTRGGRLPAWSTIRARYWKYMASLVNDAMYSLENLGRMRTGLAPQHEVLGVSRELHHIVPRSAGGTDDIENLQALWPWEHSAVDPFRHYNGPTP